MSQTLDILGYNSVQVNNDFIISASKDFENIDIEQQSIAKILIFDEKWTFEDVLVQVSKLEQRNYPNLFIFIVKTAKINSSALIDTLKIFLINFDKTRSLILQLTIQNESKSKFYYKEDNWEHFLEVDYKEDNCGIFLEGVEQVIEDSDKPSNFSQFLLMFLNRTSIDDIQKLGNVHNCPLIFKVLRILDLPEKYNEILILNCVEKGSISDVLAITDGFVNEKGAVDGNDLKVYLSYEFNETSVLMTAVKNSNMPIIKFLIKKCSNLIQQLSFEHQVAISTLAFNTPMVDILCDLLELSDYPFPENLNSYSGPINERLQKIIEQREQFHKYVIEENIPDIVAFEKKHPKLKFAFNVQNKSALAIALNSNKLKTFYFLKSLRFCDCQIETFMSEDEKDKTKAKNIAKNQSMENVANSETNRLISVHKLVNQSSIYKRDEKNGTNDEQHDKIKEWYDCIYKTRYGSKLIDAAAQCDQLRIIFDFECESVKNADASATSNVQGSTYPISKWIFIGAKISGEKEREQEIKGVIAHEICHYVMGLIYKNNDNPYYENDNYAREIFNSIVTEIGIIVNYSNLRHVDDSRNNPEGENEPNLDECEGIISSVYTNYEHIDQHQELIVRPVQLQVQFHDNKEKSNQLSELYIRLYSFFDLLVIPELTKFCYEQRKEVQKFNNNAKLLKKLNELNLELEIPNNLEPLFNSKLNIVITNTPKLFLVDIYECLTKKYKKMFDVQNIFTTSNFLKNSYDDFQKIINQDRNFNIIIECSQKFEKISNIIESNINNKLIFVVSNEYQEEFFRKIKSKSSDYFKLNSNYQWTDLKNESGKNLLQTKVSFQGDSSFSLLDLIQNQESHLDQDFENIVDEKLLNLLLNKSKIVINQFFEEDKENKYIKILFQSRSFIKISENEESAKIEQEEMLNNLKSVKFVLISDKGGAGKSWILKTFTNKLRIKYPKRWIAYVDLKQFIQEFTSQGTEFEFAPFIAVKIFKLKTKFESDIFKKLYRNGKVSIMFDGFDEIAPNYAEFVTKLFQSFQQNNGNQLWIATREFFEVDLKKNMELNAVYKLHKFDEENGINLIASSCLFDELYSKGENYNEIFGGKYAEKLQQHKILARKLSDKIPKSKNDTIGLPQFYKMIADISSSDKDFAMNFTTLTIFEKCVDIKYEIWSREKGELRALANVKSQHMRLNFPRLHQLIAMESLFPKESEFAGLCRDELKEWPDEEIIACSLVIKKNGKFLFAHETFREFYAAKFILNNLIKWQHSENVCKYLLQFLTIKKYKTIRMFLNDALGDSLFLKEYIHFPKIAKNYDTVIHEFETSFDLIEENFLNLANFVISILTYSDMEQVKNILKNKNFIILSAKHINLFAPIQAMIIDYFNKDELNDLLIQERTIHSIIVSIPDEKTTKTFLENVELHTSPQFISKALKMNDDTGRNILFHIVHLKNISTDKFKQILWILNKYLQKNEFACLLVNISMKRSFDQSKEKRQLMWNELEKIITSASFSHQLIENLNSSNYEENILHATAVCDEIEFHKKVWEVLLNTFKNREELKKFIVINKENENNFIHTVVTYEISEIIDFEFKKIKEVFNDEQYAEILRSKGEAGRNILQSAVCNSKKVEVHKILWKIFRDFYKSNYKFLEFLKEDDNQNNNVFHIASCFASKEIFELMINELEEFASQVEIKTFLNLCGLKNQNFLQLSVQHNESIELHEYLWKIEEKYFNLQQTSEMIKHCDLNGENLLYCAFQYSSNEILKLTWGKIKSILEKSEKSSKFHEYSSCNNSDQESIIHVLMKRNNSEELDFFGQI